MWAGTGIHNQIESLLDSRYCEQKVELKYKDLTLVAKADYLPPEESVVWEFKSSEKLMEKMKPWAAHQAKIYCSMFHKEKGIIYQPLQDDNGIYLKELGSVTRDDAWAAAELEKLYAFHLKVEELWIKEALTNSK